MLIGENLRLMLDRIFTGLVLLQVTPAAGSFADGGVRGPGPSSFSRPWSLLADCRGQADRWDLLVMDRLYGRLPGGDVLFTSRLDAVDHGRLGHQQQE